MIEAESPSDDRAAVARSADVVTRVVGERLCEVGLAHEPDRIEIEGVTHLRWRLGDGPRRVLLLGHHDTVWPLGSLTTHPFSVENGVMRGPGCFDMIVGIAQAAHAVAALAREASASGINPAVALDGVTLLVTGDEELGSATSRALVEDEARGCDAVLVLEAAGPGGALKTQRKGASGYVIEAVGRATHSGLDPEQGINAGIELAHALLAVQTLADATAGTTVTPTSGSIGTTTNTVPARASVNVDVRARTASEQHRVDAGIRELEPTLVGAELRITGGINRPPLDLDASAGLFARAGQLAADAGITDLASCAVGGASDGNFTAGLGVPTLDGLGAVGGGAHADTEHVLVDHIPHRTALVALLIRDVLEAQR
jgi:glutamate carboxypeptidase